MKEIVGVIIQIIFLSVSLGIAFLLLYLGLRSPRQNKMKRIDLTDIDSQGKFLGKT